MTWDVIKLKYFEVTKGIDEKWIPNKNHQGINMMENL